MNIQLESTPRILWGPPDRHAEVDCACAVENASVLWDVPEPVEGDCACSASAAPIATGLARADGDWHLAPALYRAPLPQAHELVFNPIGPAGPVVLNQPALAILDAYRHPHTLTDDTARQLAALQLLTPIRNPKSAIQNPQSPLTAWLHITDACNLRCAYCYLDKTGEAMTEDVGRAAVDAVFRSAQANGFRAIKLKYAGGEPSLNFSLVQTLHEYARHKAASTGLELREVMLSNGVALTPRMLDWLRNENVRLMISLDGVGSAHDAQRAFINGRGSFELVSRAVERALAHGLTPHLSITVTARNADQLTDAVAFALERDLPFNLNFVRDNGCKTADSLMADRNRLIAGMKAALAVIEANLPRRRLIDGLVDRSAFDAPHTHPCGAGHSYLVIDQRGRVARCQMEMSHAVADVLADDPLAMLRADGRGFQNVSVDEREGCRDCTWRYWCAGGCPLLTFRATGRSDVKSPYCDVYKALYPNVLRLEGLRLLKWGAPA